MRYLILILFLALAICAPAPAATFVIYKNGSRDVTVPASQYINVFSRGPIAARVSKQVSSPNAPVSFAKETNGDVLNQETSFGPYTNQTVVRIEAGADMVFYSVGALAAPLPALVPLPHRVFTQAAPVAYTGTTTLLASDLMNGLVTATDTAGTTVTYTLPTGTLTDAASGLSIGMAFEWSFINLSALPTDAVTIAAGTGHTLVGGATVVSSNAGNVIGGGPGAAAGGVARFLTRKTAANTFITYRW